MQRINENDLNALSIRSYVSVKPAQRNKFVPPSNFINFLEKGEKVLHYASASTIVRDTHFVILSSNNCLMTEKLAIDKEYRSTLFFFDNQHLLNFFLNYQTLIDSVSPITSQEKPFLVFPKDDFIMNYISSLRIIQRKPSDILPLLLQIKFEELMLYLLEKNPQQMMSFKSKMQEEYSEMEIKKAVEENITNNLTLNELAFLCQTSISTFKRKFVKLYKTTPSKYFLQRKMQIAASMLLQNENPSEIFYKVGYENHSSFSQSFKRIYGLSPKHFQKQRMTVSKQLLSD